MALKKGMDYFRLDSKKSPEIKSIMLSYGGQKAFGTLCSLLQWAVDSEGYYLNWGTKDGILAFCHEEMVEPNFVDEIIKIAIKKNIFDREKFEQYKILTNLSLQEDFYNCAKRRKELSVNIDFLLEPFVAKFTILSENVNILGQNVNINETRRAEQSNNSFIQEEFETLKKKSDYLEFKQNYATKTDLSFEQIPNWVDIHLIKISYDNSPWLADKTRNLNLSYWCKDKERYKKIISGFYMKNPVQVKLFNIEDVNKYTFKSQFK